MAAKKKKEEFKVSVVETEPTKPNDETNDTPSEPEVVEAKSETEAPKTPSKQEVAAEPEKSIEPTSEDQDDNAEADNTEQDASDNSVSEVKTEDTEKKKKTSFVGIFIAFLISLLLGAALIGGILYFKSSVDSEPTVTEEPTATIAPEATDEPAATEAPEALDLSLYTVQVLNGSGTAGEAGNVSALLEEAGFEDVDTGNADRYDYTDTMIQMTEDVEEGVYEAVVGALSDYSVEEGETLEEGSDYEIIVTVGSTKTSEDTSE